jgi:hypothetical protein
MFSTLRTRFGIPGVISVIALVFAMFGGAYAASNSSGGGKATASAKAKKGPRGPKGATGPAGPAGAQGPAGAKGDAGAGGTAGGVGPAGPTGPTGAKGATGATGATGVTGPTGLSGFTETLPSGKTETGTWAVAIPAMKEGFFFQVPISFPIPLAKGGTEAFFFTGEQVLNQEFGTSGCEWEQENVNAKPEATKPGTLCVFTQGGELELEGTPYFQTPGEVFGSGYGPAGSYLNMTKKSTVGPAATTPVGTWAVTAP